MNWSVPNFDVECQKTDFRIINSEPWFNEFRDRDLDFEDRFSEENWDIKWPILPDMDINWPWNNCSEVDVTLLSNPCRSSTLGYYLPYHAVLKTFHKKYGKPFKHEHVLEFNSQLDETSRYGIHLCEQTILDYIDNKLMAKRLGPEYEELALALLLQTVIAHEWGHYRSELNGIQISQLLQGLGTTSSFNYLEYFVSTAQMRNSDFEEVFADYCGIKMGVFNIRYENPSKSLTSKQKYEMVRLRLAECIFENINSPYGDLKYWMKNPWEMDEAIQKLISNPRSANKRVQSALKLNKAESPYGSTLLDVVNHNQIQYVTNRVKRNFLVGSKGFNIDFNELDSFWQYTGLDGFMKIPNIPPKKSLLIEKSGHRFSDTLLKILPGTHKKDFLRLPLLTIPELLPLDPVYIH